MNTRFCVCVCVCSVCGFGKCVYCDVRLLCLHTAFYVFVVARAFVVLNMFLFCFIRCSFAASVVAFARFFQFEKVVFVLLFWLTPKVFNNSSLNH